MWTALGLPFGWKKFRGGAEEGWIGYHLDFLSYSFGMSEGRAAWMAGWLRKTVAQGTVEMEDFVGVLGRLVFALGPMEYTRPFVSPLFAWAAAMGRRGTRKLPWAISFLLTYLADEFSGPHRMTEVEGTRKDIGTAFRADAKA